MSYYFYVLVGLLVAIKNSKLHLEHDSLKLKTLYNKIRIVGRLSHLSNLTVQELTEFL